jgi:hypothetical protein
MPRLRLPVASQTILGSGLFFEQYATYKAGQKIGIIVPKESACLPGIDPQSIQANHVDMCKFEDEDREGYKNIAQRLIRWISQLDRESREPAETQV